MGHPPGNITNDTYHTYTYDAENRITKVDNGTTATYAYDAQGRRVMRTSWTTMYYLFDLAGREIVVTDSAGNAMYEDFYAGGRHLGTYAGGTTRLAHTDWLGTERVRTGPDGTVCLTTTNLPFGDNQTPSGTCNVTTLHFTGDEYDDEATQSNLSHTLFREYSATQGRWLTPDPAGLAAVDITNPQSWNRYAYVMNRPTGLIDPYGLLCMYPDGSEDDKLGDDCTGAGGDPVNVNVTVTVDGSGDVVFTRVVEAGGSLVVFPLLDTGADYGGGTVIGTGNNGQCGPTNGFIHSGGLSYGGNADLGGGPNAGVASTASAGFGVFHDSNTGFSSGGFLAGGGAAYFGSLYTGAPKQQGQPFSFGAYAGAGPSVWVSNAQSAQQLRGPFTTWTLSLGATLVKGSIQLSYAKGIWMLSVGPPVPYVSAGTPSFSFDKLTTSTRVTNTGCKP